MVTQFTHNRLFPSHPYTGPSVYDDYAEPPVLQLAKEGVKASLNRMADTLLAPYADELAHLLKVAKLPLPPSIDWINQPCGWSVMGTYATVDYPPTLVGVLDCETLVKVKEYPVMAVYLASDGTWYCWKTPKVGEYIPLLPNSLVIGHNVAYDTALVKGRVLAIDNQVLATQVSGFTTTQQWVSYAPPPEHQKPLWAYKGYGKGNYKSLADTSEFYLHQKLDKAERNAFVDAECYEDLHENWASLLRYCANDVQVTHECFKVLHGRWKQKAPNSVSMWGLIAANSYRLPIAHNWNEWLSETEKTYQQTQQLIRDALLAVALEWVEQGHDPQDAWHSMVDWQVKPKTRKLPGMPEWYRKPMMKEGISLKSVLGHTLLKIEYLGHPVQWSRDKGYFTVEGRIPHPDGTGANVGYLFSQDFTPLFESGALSSRDARCQNLISQAYSTAYWQSVRSRALAVRVQDGWVVPMTGGGTVTGRVTEPLWLTTCDPKSKRIGSELKSRIQAPKGHKLVIADFASQELRIAWLLGDSRVGQVGGTLMSQAGIAGDKSNKTDSHSLLSQYLTSEVKYPIDRDTSKTIGYAMQYGAGAKKIGCNIRLVCPQLSVHETEAIAKVAIEYRKGKAVWIDGVKVLRGGSDSEAFNAIADIANQDRPRTPLMGREMPDPLMPLYVGSDELTTRANYVIQATAKDQLDCLCTAFSYLCQHFKVDAYINWSRHDEVMVVAQDADVVMVVEMLQQAHAFTWAALHEALGLIQMPTIGLWFEDVNVDTVCRKEVTKSCLTPSNKVEPPMGGIVTPSQLKGIARWS